MRHTVTEEWWQRLGGERERVITDGSPTGDGGLYVVGWIETGPRRGDGQGGFLTRMDTVGTVTWEFSWSDTRRPRAVTVTPTGPVVAGKTSAAETGRSDEETPAWIASFTTDGDRRWEHGYPNGDGDSFETVVATPDGVVAGGSTGKYTKRTPDSWERVYGTRDWLLAVDIEDGTERWSESYYGNDCTSLVADGTDELRYVGGSRVVWIASDGTEERSQYYDAETGSSDTLDSIAPGHRAGDSVIAGKAWEDQEWNPARLLVIDADGEIVLERFPGLPGWSNFGKDAVTNEDGYLLSGTTLLDNCSLPWLTCFTEFGDPMDFRFVVRDPGPTTDPALRIADHKSGGIPISPEGYPVTGRHAAVDVLVSTQDGLFVVYNEHDKSQSPEQRKTWIGYLT
ncbi:hypothetical protein C482_02741 [Natrialba chahannaoensis JCM 10990]|uniref:Pyrrolo-quinoline quinone n=1 Tax=Natrialba chahannaoensis JCM 10990 TaxID=1227492 RepID=M0B2C8_9EURY|nr:hypothetical protein [Natrialba chahannaoensis]ELZ05036.1 hypothetical protein C482_02741 [Natrialba chahannaoensis JCM 10990]